MRCHYEVLGVPRDADDAEIKKSYRKMALRYHPDKNPDKVDEYTEIFREIQGAYDVLSDRQERAFYDKHREAILRGGDEFVDDSVDLMQYFNPGCHTGHNDTPNGFYAVYGKVFTTVAEEEEPYLEGESADEYETPDFGDSNSDYETVVAPFYSYWLSYCTKKSFVWKDKYDIRQAPNRPTQRLMEKENKKIRDQFRRKRNEEVRALVQYIRKRDRRVKAYREQMEAAKQENKRKADQKRADDIRKRNEALEDYTEQDWMTMNDSALDNIDSHFDDQFGGTGANDGVGSTDEGSADEDVEMVDEFYCIACDKTFKSDKALSNHEKSKKHKENMELIRTEMENELANELLAQQNDDDEFDGTEDAQIKDGEAEVIKRIDSMNLTPNVVLRNVIDHTRSPSPKNSVIPEDSILKHSTDSLEYTKQRGIHREGSAKMKDKKSKKKRNNKPLYDEEDAKAWEAGLEIEEGLHPRDSLALPRRKSKKKEVRETADRLRHMDELVQKGIQATLGDSPLSDSLCVHRKKQSQPGKRNKSSGKQLFEIGGGDSESDSEEENVARSGDENPENEKNSEETKVNENIDDSTEKCAKLENSPVKDSIPYNMEKLANSQHHSKHHKDFEKKAEQVLSEVNENEEGEKSSENNNTEDGTASKKPENKKPARRNKNNKNNNSKNTQQQQQQQQSNETGEEHFTCGVCQFEFPTRNKLFAHIKAEGHAALKEQSALPENKKSKKNKKR